MTKMENAKIAESVWEVEIAAEPDKVWEGLTKRIDDWFPEDGYACGEPGDHSFHLDPVPGGQWIERWSGGGILWGTVMAATPGSMLQVQGSTFPNWGGPSIWFGTWELTPKEGGTALRFHETTIGHLTDEVRQSTDGGWTFLTNCLKAYLEGAPQPKWEGAPAEKSE